mgnify:CR=1 FL=1
MSFTKTEHESGVLLVHIHKLSRDSKLFSELSGESIDRSFTIINDVNTLLIVDTT